MIQKFNLYDGAEPSYNSEIFSTLFSDTSVKIESIRSWLNEPGEWYDQSIDEWVILFEGDALLEINDQILSLNKGDHLFIPKHTPHRVVSTSKNALWIGVFSS